MISLKSIANEAKNKYYIKDNIVILEKHDNCWGFKIYNKSGRLVKKYHDISLNKDTALIEAVKIIK